MTIPLWILAGLAIVGGYLGLPEVIDHGHYNWISHHWLAAHGEGVHGPITNLALHHLPVSVELVLISLSIIVAFAGVIIAEKLYSNKGLDGGEAKVKGLFGGFYKTLSNKFYFDEVYNAVFIRPFVALSEIGFYPIDKFVVDGLVNGAGNLTQSLGAFWRRLQSGLIQRYALMMMFGVVFILFYLMR
jgi:NADH-quinone oxidoreductase subunit L